MGEIHFPHSLGLLYSAFTYYTGFKVNSGEYKVMGLAPYGEPRYTEKILDELIDLRDDGSLRLNMKYFNYCQGLTMTNKAFDQLFGGPARKPETRITQREMDLARSVQDVTELAMLKMARHVHQETGEKNLLPGGRSGTQLRWQRASLTRGTVREDLDTTRGGRRRRGAGCGAVGLVPAFGELAKYGPGLPRGHRRNEGLLLGAVLFPPGHPNFSL